MPDDDFEIAYQKDLVIESINEKLHAMKMQRDALLLENETLRLRVAYLIGQSSGTLFFEEHDLQDAQERCKNEQ